LQRTKRFVSYEQFGEVSMISLFRIRKGPAIGRSILWLGFVLAFLFSVAAQAQVTITTTALPAGSTSNTYYATLAASGGTAPYTWQLAAGTTLPTGLSLNSSTGVISGVATAVTPGTPPVAIPFTVQVTDAAANTAAQTYSITILAAGSHSLVMNQIFTGGDSGTSSNPSPYLYNYLEIFNAAPIAVDLQNWTVQTGASGQAFGATGVAPIGSLDAYKIGTSGGPNSDGNFPAFAITYSSAFTASNCNPASTSAQVNAAFPPFHCWLNPGQYMLILFKGSSTTGVTTANRTAPEVTADLDLGALISSNKGSVPVPGSTYVALGSGSSVTPGGSGGMIALVNGIGIGVTCPSANSSNPLPSAVFSPLTSDFLAYFAQNTAGTIGVNTCWDGQGKVTIGPNSVHSTALPMGGAIHVSSSGKNFDALVRTNTGKIDTTVLQTSLAYPAGKIMATSGVTFTQCSDTDNNLTDFAPIKNGSTGQANWVLHNSSQQITSATALANTPANYTPVPCPNLNTVGPTVAASVDQPTLAQGADGGAATVTLTVTLTPSTNPTSVLFNVKADLSGIPGASVIPPSSTASAWVPDGSGNLVYKEQISIPTETLGQLTIPITVMDDAYRPAVNANSTAPLDVYITITAACLAPTATAQTVQMGWNNPQTITLGGVVGRNCMSTDTLIYAVQSQPQGGTLGAISGNSITYTPNQGFSGQDSFTFNVTDTTNSAGVLTGTATTVNLVVSAMGVTPTVTLNCPAATYDGLSHGCTASETPFIAGTTSVTYSGSAATPMNAGNYSVNAAFVSTGDSSQNTSANSTLVINQATPALTINCATVSWDGSSHGCTTKVSGVGATAPNGTFTITYNGGATLPTDGGTYAVAVSFTSSDPNYTNVSGTSSLTINEPVITITAVSQTMTYGGALPSFTYTTSPSIPLTVAPVCTSSANSSSAVGAYTGAITCTGAAKIGCNFLYVAANITILPAPATVTANNQTMAMGAAVPTLTYSTAPSIVAFTTAPKCTTTATSSSPLGAYPITCASGVSANYTLTYSGGTMTVTAAPVVPNVFPAIASMSPLSVVAGSANTVVTVTGSGFVSGSTVRWNGSNRTTAFVNSTQLTATITAADLTLSGTNSVTVFNPAPGGGPSGSETFSVDTGSATPGGFTVSPSTAAVTLPHGQSTTVYLNFASLQTGASISAVCYNLPTLATCGYNAGNQLTIGTDPTTPAGTYQVLVVCNISSAAQTASGLPVHVTMLYGFLGLPLGLLTLFRRRRAWSALCGLCALLLITFAIGCGGTAPSNSNSSPVVAAQASTTVTLTVK
jgi:hypothetical protein